MIEWLTKKRTLMIEIEIKMKKQMIETKMKKQMSVDMNHKDIQQRMNDKMKKRMMNELTCWRMQSKTSWLMHWLMYLRMQSMKD